MLNLFVLDLFSFVIPIVTLHGANAVFYNNSSNDVRHETCRLRSVRQAVDPPSVRSMTESFVLDDTEYKLCRYHVTWDEALVFCSIHKAHLATLDNEENTAFVVQAIASSSSYSEDYWIGARQYYGNLWTWTSNAKKLSDETDIVGNIPISYPGDEVNDLHCLTIDRNGHDTPIFVSRTCNQKRGFICQRDNERTYDNKIRLVAASRIGEQEFHLYSGKVTWAEAVVQCREEGLQIGEVNTAEEARALAVSMLRNRPEGIESAWIGGYTRKNDADTWRWLASGEKINNNEMWRNNLTESYGGCLLLDRHLCETPVYVETTCDRKRDVLCQKPPKKRLSRKLIEVIVDNCPYWIGFHPLQWMEAKRSCETVNASLVVLDSQRTITHMMNLMADNRAELRHIWIGGRRSRKYGKWLWEVNGEPIRDFGNTFIPWCPDDDNFVNETDCLNLDRENFRSPLVYGFSCREKQSYICQPLISDCVSHTSSAVTEETKNTSDNSAELQEFLNLSTLYENTETLQWSKATGTSPIDNYATITTATTHDHRHHIDELHHWKPGNSVSLKNSTPDSQLRKYLKPFSRIILPTLPQFGIKVVSALETTTNSQLHSENKKTKKLKQLLTSASYVVKSTISPPMHSSPMMSATLKKSSHDSRKALQGSSRSSNFSSVTSNVGGYVESGKTSNLNVPKISKTSTPKMSNPKLITMNTKDLNLTKIERTFTSILPEGSSSSSHSQKERTRKYSVKTTRDLNSNVTKIAPIATTKNLDPNVFSNAEKRTTISNILFEDSKNIGLKTVNVESKTKIENFPPHSLQLITTPLSRMKQKLRFTPESTTPYDLIDDDYYDNYEAKNSKIKEKMKNENYDELNSELDEYGENYEASGDENFQSKKKVKQTSTSSIRRSYTTVRSAQKLKPLKPNRPKNIEVPTMPIAHDMSKHLQEVLINMLKEGVAKKQFESDGDVAKSTIIEETTGFPIKINIGRKNSTIEHSVKNQTDFQNWTLRPYYAFEGPMVVGLYDGANVGRNSQRDKEHGTFHQFQFAGRRTMDEFANFSPNKNSDTRRFNQHGTGGPYGHGSLQNNNIDKNIPLSISDLPSIRPNDPNSLMQMGRYFKNKFGNIVSNGGPISETMGRDDAEQYSKNHEAKGIAGRLNNQNVKFRGQNAGRYREQFPMSRNNDFRRNGHRYANSNTDYAKFTRRLHPRGDYDNLNPIFSRRNVKQNVDNGWSDEHERLSVSWPRRNLTDSETFHFDESQVVSPRNYPAPIRTTRSFSEDSKSHLKKERSKIIPFPDFQISKLIKEVKIDMDQRLLRKYLEAFAKRVVRKDGSSYRKDDWKDTWRYLLDQMSRILGRMNINVNGDVMKVRVGTNSPTRYKNIKNWRKDVSKSGLKERQNKFTNRPSVQHAWRQRMRKMNETTTETNLANRSSKLMETRLISPNSLYKVPSKEILLMNRQIVDGYKINSIKNDATEQSPLQRAVELNLLETKLHSENGQSESAPVYNRTMLGKSRNHFLQQAEPISRTSLNHRQDVNRLNNNQAMENWYRPKYTSNNDNSRTIVAPVIIPSARLSQIYAYQPIRPQLRPKIIFRPDLNQLRQRPTNTINNATQTSSILNGEHLPKGTLSKGFMDEHKNQNFNTNSGSSQLSQYFRDSSRSSQVNDREMSSEKFTDIKLDNSSFEIPRGFNARDKAEDQNVELQTNVDKGNKLESQEFNHSFNETNAALIEGDIEDGENERISSSEDYVLQPIWSPAHRLGKALELSHLRKFRQNLSNPSTLNNFENKNSETTENFEILSRNGRSSDKDRTQEEIEKNLESLKDEPSTVSLSMIIKPEKHFARTSRQSIYSAETGKKPQTVEFRFRFLGNEKNMNSKNEQIVSNLYDNERKKIVNFGTIGNQSFKRMNKSNEKFDTTQKIPIRFLDKIHRRAMINKLRESIKWGMKNDSTSSKSRNGTSIINPRDRKSRTINAEKNEQNSVDRKTSKKNSGVKHYLASSLRSVEDKNYTKKSNSIEKEIGIDWGDQVASLFTDLKENNNQFTLYIDLTLGRVGIKSRRSEQPRR